MKNKLLLNASKSKAMVISESEIDVMDPVLVDNPVVLNDEVIHYVRKAKVLGLWINNTMTWSDQVSQIKRKVYGTLRCLWNCGPFLPINKRIMLVKTLLIPHFMYGDSVMCDMDAPSKHTLEIAMNACTRFAYKMKRRDHISDQEKTILGCTYPNYRKYRMCLFIRSVLCAKSPDYFYEMFQLSRSRRNPSLIVPRVGSAMLRNSFFTQVASLWNSLPLELKRNMSSVSFPLMCLEYFSDV